jgi:hypothetical protein
MIASRSLSSGAHSRDPLARNDGLLCDAVIEAKVRGTLDTRFGGYDGL